jgi:hypothetical protein
VSATHEASETTREHLSAPPRHFNLATLGRKVEFGDLLLPFYAAVFLRQCFWPVGSEPVAWALTAALSLLLWLVYLWTKPEVAERTPRVFWLVVALPLFLFFALRAPFPDLSFDVLNQRLLQGERALRGPQFLPGDFFPTVFPFNPSSDMLTGVFRHALGYRLGTVVNLLALVWAGTIVERLLRPFVRRDSLRAACVLLALFTEHVLFEVNNYMVDLLALPLALEALSLALDYDESKSRGRDLIYAALLLGAGVGLKLTNAAVALPVAAAFAARVFSARFERRTLVLVLIACAVFFLPLLPHAVYIWRETGSPVFPLYNNLVHSPLWPNNSPYDGRWGPRDLRETLLWPLVSAWEPERLSELGVYSGRLAVAFVAAALCLVLPRAGSRARLIALVVLLGSLMWAATSGYVRYALFVEITGGALVVFLARYAWERATRLTRGLRLAAAALPLCLLAAQCAVAAVYVRRTEWGGRPTVFDDWAGYRKELRWVWRDRDLMSFQPEETRELFVSADAWVVSAVKTNGVEALLRPDLPALGVIYNEYFDRPEARRRFASAAESLRGKRVFTLALDDELDAALETLRRRRLGVGEIRHVSVPFFSGRTRLPMSLVEVLPPEKHETPRRGPGTPDVTEAAAPLDDEAFVASFSVADMPAALRAGQRATIRVVVTNRSESVWPSRGRKDDAYLINLSDTWLASDGERLVNNLDGRNGLPHDLWPGESVEIALDINAPKEPGDYVVEIGLVQEGVAFFKDKGAETWRARVKVE